MSQMGNPSLGSFQVSAESSHGFVATPQNKKEREGETDQALGDPRPQAVCRFFSLGRHCNFGRKCRFLHVKGGGSTLLQGKLDNSSNMRPEQDKQKQPAGESQSDGLQQDIVSERPGVDRPSNPRAAPAKSKMPISRRPCRYYLSGFCSMEDRCRFFHPTQFPSVADQSMLGDESRPRQLTPAPKPSVLQEVKVAHLTEEIAKKLRDTEIKQMMKRFPNEQLIIQERSDCQVTFYRITVAATDPDWPFDLKEVDIMVSFPEKYPQEVFTLDIPLDQELPSVMGRHVQQASVDWLQAKHATNELMGKVELLLRPYLRWLDRSMERLFTEGARVLKKDMDVAKAGLQFVPYQQLQATVGKDPANPDMGTAADEVPPREVDEEDEENMEMRDPEIDPESDDETEEDQGGLGQVEHIKPIEPRRGTELKLLGLRLGEDTATVVAQHITVCLQCNRCKVTADLSLSGRTPCTAQCEKCNAEIRAAFRPGMLHQYSDVLGHLDLSNAAAMDLVLQDCQLVVGCLGCSQESPVQGFSYGQAMLVNCEHCYSQLSILVESTRFQNIQPRLNKTGQDVSNLSSRLPFRDPAVQKGKPLPDKGICKHFKQSHRWLRFPCCGRAYPCDVCHDEDQDHPMELATRMICGHCAKEQMYSNGKACVGCGNMMTRGAHTSHWEGGLGCRNKVKMNRNDRHKYTNTNKTVSRKAGCEK